MQDLKEYRGAAGKGDPETGALGSRLVTTTVWQLAAVPQAVSVENSVVGRHRVQ